jgi:dephospho-CoA kinase
VAIPDPTTDSKRPQALVVAVTGGIASGKSALTSRLEQLGVPVFDADVVTRELSAPGQPALREIAERFGPSVMAHDGSLDRRALRARVFADAAERRALEAILHPRVRERLAALAAGVDGPYCVLAIPLLAEGNRYPWIDRVVVVDAPDDVRIERLVRRDGIDQALARRMLESQAPRAARLAIADEIIDNTGSLEELIAATDTLHQRLLGLAAGPHGR